jgi:hypothetical protein
MSFSKVIDYKSSFNCNLKVIRNRIEEEIQKVKKRAKDAILHRKRMKTML